MGPRDMWNEYCEQEGVDAQYDAWAFGVSKDLLADLVLRGIKTATASAYPLYEIDGEPLPQEGQYSVILNSREEAVCVIRTQKVYVVPFNLVTREHAWKEGEDDRSLESWRRAHRSVFEQWLEEAGLSFSEEMPVVCEEFVRVFP